MFGWFGRKGAPELDAVRLCAAAVARRSRGEGFARGYEAQLHEGLSHQPGRPRAVRLVAGSVAWAPVYAESDEAGRRS